MQSFIAKKLDESRIVVVYSVDLSAAFDLLRYDTFDYIVGPYLSDGLRFALLDFLSNRSLVVQVGKESSPLHKIDIECVQGSTLGPLLFTLYMRGIYDHVSADKFICYADNSYVLCVSDTGGSKRKIKSISLKHVDELKRRGIKVNEDKTEVMIFSKKGQMIKEFNIAGTRVTSGVRMKALGVIFDNNLTWQHHIENNIKMSTWKLTVLREIRHKFNFQQFSQILTAQFFGKFYYCSQVWVTSATKRKFWNFINSQH